jgi:hypothetical protein
MRTRVQLADLVLLVVTALPAGAAGFDRGVYDQQSIDALAARANLAQPREQCFLYAELVHQLTEFSLQQYAAGDVKKAGELLQQTQQLATKIHLSVAVDNKRLKNAEILLRQASFRLNEMLHFSRLEDRPLVEQTLAQVNQAETDAMMQVFRK